VPIQSTYTAPTAAPNYKGCLYAIGIVALVVVAIATYGLILIPTAIGLGVWIWYRRRQPDSVAARIITQAVSSEPPEAVSLLNQALVVDPHGLKTLAVCANWFFEHQCYQDAAEAYAGILHGQADLTVERKYVACLLGAGRADEAIPRLESLRSTTSADDALGVAVLNELATAYFLKGDPAQALAFVGLAPLQKRNLDSDLQLSLYLRGVGRYLTGDHRHAVSDLERLYAVNPSFADVMAAKAAMQAGTFTFSPAKPYPDWYPTDHREVALPSEPQVEIADSPSGPDPGSPPALETADRTEVGPPTGT
jgi:tetratricopeptide (TPR) repeat protein